MQVSVGLALLSINKDNWTTLKVEGVRGVPKYFELSQMARYQLMRCLEGDPLDIKSSPSIFAICWAYVVKPATNTEIVIRTHLLIAQIL